MLAENGWSEQELLSNYDAVVHLTTAADGLCFSYFPKKAFRIETKEMAVEADIKLQEAWAAHHSAQVVKNSPIIRVDELPVAMAQKKSVAFSFILDAVERVHDVTY